jgi:hypothetical protein
MKSIIAVAAGCAAALTLPAYAAQAKPCDQHAGTAKQRCVAQLKRDRLAWPPRPSEAEVIKRIGIAGWNKAMRVAYCETGANWQHYPHGRFIGGLGMARSTYGIGQAVTRYRWPHEGASRAEQVAVGWIIVTRYGWSAWGCGSA